MATTTATKRKLVYRQDPDGVFRLKKREDPIVASTTRERLGTKSSHDYVNDLIACLVEGLDTVNPEPEKIATTTTQINKPTLEVTTKDNRLAIDFLENQTLLHTEKTTTAVAEPSPTSTASSVHSQAESNTTTTTTTTTPPVIHTQLPVSTPFRTHLFDTPQFFTSDMMAYTFHIPSFAGGVLMTIALYYLSPLIAYYTQSLLYVLRVGVIWGAIIGAVCWYLGIIRSQDTVVIKQLLARLQAKVPGGGTTITPVAIVEEHHVHPDIHTDDDMNSISSEDHKDLKSVEISRSASPTKAVAAAAPITTRRNTLTEVKPFFYTPPKHQQHMDDYDMSNPRKQYQQHQQHYPERPNSASKPVMNGAPPQLARYQTDEPVHVPRRERERRGRMNSSSSLTDLAVPRGGGGDRRNGILTLAELGRKNSYPISPQYPTHEAQELPFANEVKLISEEYGEDGISGAGVPVVKTAEPLRIVNDGILRRKHDVPPKFSNDSISRLNTVLSKKSVLGTRSNYNKFVANVHGDDY